MAAKTISGGAAHQSLIMITHIMYHVGLLNCGQSRYPFAAAFYILRNAFRSTQNALQHFQDAFQADADGHTLCIAVLHPSHFGAGRVEGQPNSPASGHAARCCQLSRYPYWHVADRQMWTQASRHHHLCLRHHGLHHCSHCHHHVLSEYVRNVSGREGVHACMRACVHEGRKEGLTD